MIHILRSELYRKRDYIFKVISVVKFLVPTGMICNKGKQRIIIKLNAHQSAAFLVRNPLQFLNRTVSAFFSHLARGAINAARGLGQSSVKADVMIMDITL